MLEFCDHGDSDVPHNMEAETPQNKFCRGKSAWEVMRLHPDFKGNSLKIQSLYISDIIFLSSNLWKKSFQINDKRITFRKTEDTV